MDLLGDDAEDELTDLSIFVDGHDVFVENVKLLSVDDVSQLMVRTCSCRVFTHLCVVVWQCCLSLSVVWLLARRGLGIATCVFDFPVVLLLCVLAVVFFFCVSPGEEGVGRLAV